MLAHPKTHTSWNYTTQFFVFILPLLVVLIVAAVIHYQIHIQLAHQKIQRNDALNIELMKKTIASVLDNIVSDLLFLAEHNEISGNFDHNSLSSRINIIDEFVVFAKNKKLYDQIRYIDNNGKEVVRINFNSGVPIAVPNKLLQEKKERYYFNETIKLNKREIYWSPFDLNIENGVIERPVKPTIRIGTPVFNRSGEKTGIFLLNYFGENLINELFLAGANISGEMMLLNDQGYWLIGPHPKQEWGFMFNNNYAFSTTYSHEWDKIYAATQGQFYSANGLFTFTTTFPQSGKINSGQQSDKEPAMGFWKITSRVSPGTLANARNEFINQNFWLYIIIFILALFGSAFASRLWVKHKHSEAQIEYERGFRNILENVQLAAVSLDKNGKILFCNNHLLHLSGWEKNEVLGKNWFSTFISENHRNSCKKIIAAAISSSTGAIVDEGEIITRRDENRLIAWNATLSYDIDNDVSGITLLGTDITEQRKNEEQLRKLSQVVEQSPSTVMITNKEGYIEYTNPKFTQLTGYTPNEVIGQKPSILKSGETSRDEYNNLWQTIMNGGEWKGEFHNQKKSGELYWEAARISAIRNTEGKITHFLAVKEDITERKLLQNEVEKHNQQIQKNKELAAIGRMANMIAHDLRNPLSSIKMGMRILEKSATEFLGDQERELISIGQEQVKYMESILSDMLSYSRPENLQLEWLNLDKLTEMAILNTQKQLEEYGVSVSTHFPPGLPTIHGDSTRLRQALSNLILNAAQATENNKGRRLIKIETQLQLTSKGTRVLVEIIDNGYGIDTDKIEQLFEPFYTTRAKGTGLGLAIIKRIIDQHHGEIKLEPMESAGTRASIIFSTGIIERRP
jgi:PAS domain S-box-containing protein